MTRVTRVTGETGVTRKTGETRIPSFLSFLSFVFFLFFLSGTPHPQVVDSGRLASTALVFMRNQVAQSSLPLLVAKVAQKPPTQNYKVWNNRRRDFCAKQKGDLRSLLNANEEGRHLKFGAKSTHLLFHTAAESIIKLNNTLYLVVSVGGLCKLGIVEILLSSKHFEVACRAILHQQLGVPHCRTKSYDLF